MIFTHCPFCQTKLVKQGDINAFCPGDHTPHLNFKIYFRRTDNEFSFYEIEFFIKDLCYVVLIMDAGSKIYIEDKLKPGITKALSEHRGITVEDWDWSSIEAFEAQMLAILAFS